MGRRYTMRGVMATADLAVELARQYLLSLHPDARLHDVQADPRFQHRGVDLLVELPSGALFGVEVKGDRQRHRGNYFFELVSNAERNTPGCFLYSEAARLIYVFVENREVHDLPLPAVRSWFLPNASQFPLRHTQTRVGNSAYTTVGALVPVKRVLTEVAEARRQKAGPIAPQTCHEGDCDDGAGIQKRNVLP